MHLERELTKLGFSEKEAKVYLASLELGVASAAEIAIRSGINRATTYVIIDELKKRGLVTSFEKGNAKGRTGKKTFFVAETPEQLRHILSQQLDQLRTGISHLDALLPQLAQLFTAKGERPIIRFFDGRDGVSSLREDIWNTKKTYIYEFVNLDESYRFFPADHAARKSVQQADWDIPTKTIYTATEEKHFDDASPNQQFKYLPGLQFSGEVVLFEHKAAMIAHKENLYGILIEDMSLTMTLKTLFEILWERV